MADNGAVNLGGINEAGIESLVLATSPGGSVYDSLPALTTVYTYAPECRSRWVMRPETTSLTSYDASGMTHVSGGLCTGYNTEDVTAYFPDVIYSTDRSGTYTYTSFDYDGTKSSTIVTVADLTAEPVYVYWQSKDLSSFEPHYASAIASRIKIPFTVTDTPSIPTNTASPASTSSVPGPTAASADSSELSSPSGLSTGAKAGIAVGAIAGFAIFAVIAFLLFARYRRRKPKLDQTPELDRTKADAPELVQLRSPGP
ncbi:hypothetical protein NX059_002125 [Plenodomus lindquistii]|nr:hypothetical protein NX059_002125 [Plenodomus lindquistii]